MKIKLSILTIMAVCATVPACADPSRSNSIRPFAKPPSSVGFITPVHPETASLATAGVALARAVSPMRTGKANRAIFVRPGHRALPRWR